MSDLIRYHNTINRIKFNAFTEKEMNVLFSIIYKMQNQGTEELILPFVELRELSKGDINLPRFLKSVENVAEKISKLNYRHEDDDEIVKFYFFKKFVIKKKEKILKLSVNEHFQFLINDLVKKGKFTILELENFIRLKSVNSKSLYRLLKQWNSTKVKVFKLEELREVLNVPEHYTTSRLNQKILYPAIEEVKNIIPTLEHELIKKGKTIIAIKFKWRELNNIEIPEDKVLEVSEKLANAFEKTSKNRYIKPFLTEKGKSELLEAFGEEALIRGLHFAYKVINKEFKSLVYLTRVIETGAKEQKVVIKTVKKDKFDIEVDDIQNDNIRQTSFDELPKEKKERVLKQIYEDEFEKLYKKYLEDNNSEDRPIIRQCFAMPYKIIKREEALEEKKNDDEE